MAHRDIEIAYLETTQENIGGENNNGNDSSGFNGCFYGSLYGGGNAIGSDSLANIVTDTTNNGLSSSVVSTSSSSEQFESSVTRPLVVVDVRGSVTLLDWIMNFLTQGHLKFYEFEDGACQSGDGSLIGYI